MVIPIRFWPGWYIVISIWEYVLHSTYIISHESQFQKGIWIQSACKFSNIRNDSALHTNLFLLVHTYVATSYCNCIIFPPYVRCAFRADKEWSSTNHEYDKHRHSSRLTLLKRHWKIIFGFWDESWISFWVVFFEWNSKFKFLSIIQAVLPILWANFLLDLRNVLNSVIILN